ncbi:lytic transglycosylase domain-containing protein [Dokdonella soli]|uniref:Transglycosylase SLT domain-containing protein n=1 Tax=Dokdonella soli TaxID=529810 RepID=A0ABN1IU59_9GAMM
MRRTGREPEDVLRAATAITRWTLISLLMWWVLIAGCLAWRAAHAGVPELCRQYQRQITSEAYNLFGLNAPVSTLAAQIHQESGCHAAIVSRSGAEGLAQFMPDTAQDMARLYPTELGPADPTNPRWAIAAQARYMRDLMRDHAGRTECDTWAFGLAAYNGGSGWVDRDIAVCRRKPINGATCACCVADRWFGNVELSPDLRRSPSARAENRGYPRVILLGLTPVYVAGGYGRGVECRP